MAFSAFEASTANHRHPSSYKSEKVYACSLSPPAPCINSMLSIPPIHRILLRRRLFPIYHQYCRYSCHVRGLHKPPGYRIRLCSRCSWPLQFITSLTLKELRPSSVQRDGLIAIPTLPGVWAPATASHLEHAVPLPASRFLFVERLSFVCILERASPLVRCPRSGPVSLADGH